MNTFLSSKYDRFSRALNQSGFPVLESRAYLRPRSFAKPIATKFFGDSGVECFRRREIGAAPFGIILTQAGETAAVKRARLSRIVGQRRIVIDNRLLEPAKLQICEAAVVEGARVIGREPQGFVAVRKRFLKTAQYRTIPAAIVPGLGVPWLNDDETAVILGGAVIKAGSLMRIAALRQSFNVAWGEAERRVIIRDCSGIVLLLVMGASWASASIGSSPMARS
jgi:hypothetical protein